MKTKKKLISILLTVSMMLTMFPFAAFAQDANDTGNVAESADVVLPKDVNEASFGDNTVYYAGNYYKTLVEALKAAAGVEDAVLYCKPGAKVGDMTHGHVCASMTVYGNDAWVEGGENEFEVDTYYQGNPAGNGGHEGCPGLKGDITLTINNLNNSGVWGQRTSNHTINVVMNNCKNAERVYISNATGVTNITINGNTYTEKATDTNHNVTGDCAIYSNAPGTIKLEGCQFESVPVPINFNNKSNGAQTIKVSNTTFNNCATKDITTADQQTYASGIRVLSTVEGGSSVLNVDKCTFTYDEGKVKANGDILLGDGRANGKIYKNATLSIVNTAADVQMQKPGYYTADGKTEASKLQTATVEKSAEPTTLSVVEAFAVAKVGADYYESLEEAVRAANGKTVTLLKDVTIDTWTQVWDAKNLTIDGNGKTLTVGKIESGVNGDYLFYGAENLNVSDLNVVFGGKGNGFDMKSGSLTNVKMTDADKATNKYAVFVGAGDGKVSINGCTFKNFGMGVYSQPTGQPTAAIAIDNSTFDNCDYPLVSYAADTAFTDNNVQNSGEISFAAAADSANNAENIKYTVTGNTLQDAGKVWFYGGDLNKVDFEKNKVLGNTKVDTTDAKADTTLDVSNNYWGGQAPSKNQLVGGSDAIKGDDVYYEADTMQPEDLNTYEPPVVVTRYDVIVSDTDNGTITATHKRASKNSTVTITATPDEGYVVDAVTVTEKDGDKVEVTKKDDNKYTFKMPASDVTVKATFKVAPTEPEQPTGLPFTDVAKDAWYFPAVEYVFNNGLMNGTTATTFAPNVNLNRAMMAAVLYNMEGKPVCDKSGLFSDVADGKWYTDAVNWAASNNIVSGMPDGTYAPNQALTREQMASILYRYAEYKGIKTDARADLGKFTDGNTTSAWATDVVQWAVAEKLINGVGTELQPKGTASRAQVATVLMNYCENVAK